MYILVTGGAGYIGSHTVKMLLEQGYNVLTLDNLSKGHRDAVLGGWFVEGDLKDRSILKDVFSNYDIGVVIHFAANSLVGESMTEPGKYFGGNIIGDVNLLEAMNEAGVDKIIFSSSAAVYGEPKYSPIDESHPLNPTNVYGETKVMFEKILRWYDQIFGIRSISLRYFNAAGADPTGVIGERHFPETHLIPLVLQAATFKGTIKVYGTDFPTKDGTCVRDYIHVNDLSEVHVLALEALLKGCKTTSYNLGNGNGFTVMEVIRTAEMVTGRKISFETAARRAGDPAILVAGSDRIRRDLSIKFKYPDLKIQIETAWNYHRNRK